MAEQQPVHGTGAVSTEIDDSDLDELLDPNRHRSIQNEMVGDLPVKDYSHWRAFGDEYWQENHGMRKYQAEDLMVDIQHDLHEQGQKEEEVALNSTNALNLCVPYHEDVLDNWEAFSKAQKSRTTLKEFRIARVTIPPSPYLSNELMSVWKNNNGMTYLQLHDCGLGEDDIKSLASYLSENTLLATLDISGNQIRSVEAAKCLAVAMKNHPGLCFANFSDVFGSYPPSNLLHPY